MSQTPAELARRQPPRLLAAFHAVAMECGDFGSMTNLTVEIACGQCRSDRLTVLGHTTRDDREWLNPPFAVRCDSCGHRAHLFDPRRDGYDGEVGDTSYLNFDEQNVAEIPCEKPAGAKNLYLVFTYNIEIDELLEISAEDGCGPADLFDWFHAGYKTAEKTDEDDFIIDYECA